MSASMLRNQVLHADSLVIMRSLPDVSVDFIFTDPPYGHNNNNGDLIHRWEKALGLQTHEEAVRKGERLTMDAAQGADEHPFNLYLTLTPEFREDGTKYPHGVVSVEKNSTGNTGQVRLHVKWAQLLVVDEIAQPPAHAQARAHSHTAATAEG